MIDNPNGPMPAADGSAEFADSTITGGDPVAPLEVQLKPGSDLHGKVLQKIRARLELSHRHQSTRYDNWDKSDEKRRLYVNLARPARRGDNTVDTSKKEMPFDRAIVMPMTYAIIETRKTEIFSQFSMRSPFTQLDGRGMEDEKAAKLTEIKLEYDYQQGDGPISVYSLINDTESYGVGTIYDHWDEVSGWISQPPDPMAAMVAQVMGMPPPEPTQVWGPIQQLTRWSPVDPYLDWPDPRVTKANIQNGEFHGHRSFRAFYWLLERSQENGGNYFNLDELRKMGQGGEGSRDTRIATRNRSGTDAAQFALRDSSDPNDKGYYIIDAFQIKIIPSEWKVGPGDKPEIWWFAMADERLIIRAHKSPYQHNQFTYSTGESNFDPHQYANPGTVELLDGLQRTTDWLVNSRIENIRKFLNDMLLFSPELIEEDDIRFPGAARWIRTTQQGTLAAMQGLSFDNMIKQFEVRDVTGTHFEVTQFLMDMANKLGAANDTMQGVNPEQDRTLGENQMAATGGSKRLVVVAKMLDATVFKPLGLRAISNAQQYYDMAQWIRLVGEDLTLDPEGLGRIQVSRKDLAGNFDYVPMTALTPQDPARMLEVWQKVFEQVVATPALSTPDPLDPQVANVKKIFKAMCRMGGMRDIDGMFQALPQMAGPGGQAPGVLPDQQIEQGVQAGNLVPMGAQGLPQ